jgi:alpha-D-xyloside xylohydrolase
VPRPTYEIPRFLGDPPIPVELIAEVIDYAVDGRGVTFRCASKRYLPQLHNYYGSLTETVWDAPTPGQPVTVRMDVCTPEIVRIRIVRGDDVPENALPMVVGVFDDEGLFSVTEHSSTIVLETSAIRVASIREPWQIVVTTLTGDLIWQTRPIDVEGLRRPSEQWNPPQQRWIFLHRYAYPTGTADHGERKHSFLSFDLHYDEHIYGFGESYGRLDKRETYQALWIQESFSNASPASYKRTPFFMSSRGYGLYFNTANAVRCRVGDLEHTAFSVIVDDTNLLDLYFMYGPLLRDILPRYTSITGQPAVPPKWTFGLWMARISYNRQDQVESVARELRQHRIPCDVIHIDTDWYEKDWQCDLEFGPSKFPDPRGMTSRLAEMGFKVSLWQWPNMVVTSEMFFEGYEQGYLAKKPNGKPWIYPGFEIDAGYIDYSNPEAVTWVQGKIRKLFEQGIAAIKVDFGEGASPDAVHASVSGEQIHSLYPFLYNKALWDVSEEYFGQGNAVLWARAAWAGSQRFPVHWSGDGVARYEDLACVLRAALSFGLSGFPFYSHDIGGFSGVPSPELYVRWAQFGLFSSHSRAHGMPPREPWAYGEEAERIFRQYADLRYSLMPYIYSEAICCGRSSLPMLRALVLEYQDDLNTYTIEDQYLFGSSLLIAPILDESNRRRVYLPLGLWTDYWTKQVIPGGRWIHVEAALDTMPMYVREGAIIPYGPPLQYVDEKPLDTLRVEIYQPSQSNQFVIHDQRDITIRYTCEGGQVRVDCDHDNLQLIIYGAQQP